MNLSVTPVLVTKTTDQGKAARLTEIPGSPCLRVDVSLATQQRKYICFKF